MNLKKISGVVVSCLMAGSLFAGCAPETSENDSPHTRIAMIGKLNASEEVFNQTLKSLEKVALRPGLNLSHNYHYYEGTTELLMALEAHAVDEISTYRSVANYISAQNPNLEILNHTVNMFDSFCCALRKGDTELLAAVDSAIDSMKNDGTLDALTKKYITDLNPNENPPAVEMPKIIGADTVKVGITGDLPPLDMVLADGTPAGFNTALISEIGKRINKNIEIVQIESTARALALTSNQIDVVFWVTVPGEFWQAEIAAEDLDKTADLDITAPYFEDEIVHVDLKK